MGGRIGPCLPSVCQIYKSWERGIRNGVATSEQRYDRLLLGTASKLRSSTDWPKSPVVTLPSAEYCSFPFQMCLSQQNFIVPNET